MLILLILAIKQFEIKHTIWPPSTTEKSLFGRAVAFSNSRIAIAAEYLQIPGYENNNNNYTGGVYIYDYDSTSDSYKINKGIDNNRLYPLKVDGIKPSTLGSRLIISSDGKSLLAGAPYSDIRTDYPNIHLDSDYKTHVYKYNDGTYYREIGALYLFTEDEKGNWHQEYISVPENIICLGGYGRSMSGSRDLQNFVGAYYNKIGKGIPEIVGQVFVTRKINSTHYIQTKVEPPPGITFNKTTQRFGASLSFHRSNELYITTLSKIPEDQGKGDEGGVYEYAPDKDHNYNYKSSITVDNSKDYDQFGIKSTFLGETLAAIYGRKNMISNDEDSIFLIQKEESQLTWPKKPFQIITFTDAEVSDIYLCSADVNSESTYLAVTASKSGCNYNDILIYERKINQPKFELIQNITEPKISRPGVDVPYDKQGVNYGSDFSWDKDTCKRFIVGAMGKDGEKKNTKPNEFSRAYVYEMTENNSGKSKDKTTLIIIIVCVVVAVVLVVVIVVTVILIRRKKRSQGEVNDNMETIMDE